VLDLENSNSSFILISSDNLEDVMSILWAKEYKVIKLKSYYKENYGDCIFAYSQIDNDQLRIDLIFLLNHLHINSAIIKYRGENKFKMVYSDGQEKPISISYYNTDDDKESFIYNGVSFSFIEEKMYWRPNKKEDFKIGMIVEYLNNNKWYQQTVKEPEIEFENLYKLLIKYDKIRVAKFS
jgi:hypothetical protein